MIGVLFIFMDSHEFFPRLYEISDPDGNKMIVAGTIDFDKLAKDTDSATTVVPVSPLDNYKPEEDS